METLHLLEEKLKILVSHIKKLQAEKESLAVGCNTLKQEHADLRGSYDELVQENKKLQTKVKELQKMSAEGSKELQVLNKEREQTILAVDDLIKSIDGFVVHEAQQ